MLRNRLFEDIRENAQNRLGRIALIFAALTIGILSLTVLAGVLRGLELRGERLVSELGANVISVAIEGKPQIGFPIEVLSAVQESLGSEALVSGLYQEDATLSDYDQSVTLSATDENLQTIKNWTLDQGRWLDLHNVQQGDAVCILSAGLAQKLKLQLQQTISVKNTPLTIIGILQAGVSPETTLYVPRNLQPDWNNETAQPNTRIQEIILQAQRMPWQTLQQRAQNILMAKNDLREGLNWTTSASLTRDIKKLQTSLKWTAGSVAVLCLLLGGATLMSLMTANVRERIPEIGLRLSLGAAPRDIYTLFLVEAFVITLIAACIGSIGGHLLLTLGPLPEEIPYASNLQTLLLPSACCIIMALFFSWGPASMAAKINPADALRHE